MPFDNATYRPIPEGHRRLLVLAEFLETVPAEKIDLSLYSRGNECGTAGCALGWACTIPEFKALGLHFQNGLWPAYGGSNKDPISAAQGFFSIDQRQAIRFFADSRLSGDDARAHVIARIRTFVAEQAKVPA